MEESISIIFKLKDSIQVPTAPFKAEKNRMLPTPPWVANSSTRLMNPHRTYVAQSMFESLNREAHRLVLEGAAPAAVDAVLSISKLNLGILESNDYYGIDLLFWDRIKKRTSYTCDLSYFVLGDALFKLGRYGIKSGRGFYKYEGLKTADPEVLWIAATLARETDVLYRNITEQEIRERFLYTIITESVNLAKEHPFLCAHDIAHVSSQVFKLSSRDGNHDKHAYI